MGGHDGNNGKAGKPLHPWEPRVSDLSSKADQENWVGCFVLLALITTKRLSYSPPTTPVSLTSTNLAFYSTSGMDVKHIQEMHFQPQTSLPLDQLGCKGLQHGDVGPDVWFCDRCFPGLLLSV